MAIGWIKATADYELTEQVNREDESMKVIIRYTPLGVSVGIVPWNFPIALASIKIVSSLLTGCPIIVKPSPFTPYCNLKMVELAQKFFPPGVIQVLSGDDNLGPWLTAHPGPDKISFTGSTATGKKVMENASKTLKRVTLELYAFSSCSRRVLFSLTSSVAVTIPLSSVLTLISMPLQLK